MGVEAERWVATLLTPTPRFGLSNPVQIAVVVTPFCNPNYRNPIPPYIRSEFRDQIAVVKLTTVIPTFRSNPSFHLFGAFISTRRKPQTVVFWTFIKLIYRAFAQAKVVRRALCDITVGVLRLIAAVSFKALSPWFWPHKQLLSVQTTNSQLPFSCVHSSSPTIRAAVTQEWLTVKGGA